MNQTVKLAVSTPSTLLPALLAGDLSAFDLNENLRPFGSPRYRGPVLNTAGKAPAKGGKKAPKNKKSNGPGKLKDGGGGTGGPVNPH